MEMPMLAETKTSCPSMMNGWASESRIRRATLPASSGCGSVGQKDGEFISAETGEGMRRFVVGMTTDRVALTNGVTQPLRHMREQEVSHGMSQRIIDDLKTIQVDKQRRNVQVSGVRHRRAR